jgi:hypothetical protein
MTPNASARVSVAGERVVGRWEKPASIDCVLGVRRRLGGGALKP